MVQLKHAHLSTNLHGEGERENYSLVAQAFTEHVLNPDSMTYSCETLGK